VLLPAISLYDPAASGEGRSDPLGLEPIASRLADLYLPGITSRMWRIRALTIMAVGAEVCESMVDTYSADGSAPAYLAFEWIWAEAMTSSDASFTGLPGIDTARRRAKAGERLSTRNYLRNAASLGLHGFYRTLARDALIVGAAGELEEQGERLIRAWADDEGLPGYLTGSGEGSGMRSRLRDAVRRSLDASCCAQPKHGQLAAFLRSHLSPQFGDDRHNERSVLRFVLDAKATRSATLSYLNDLADGDRTLTGVAKKAAADDAPAAEDVAQATLAMAAFERLSGALSEAFELVLHRSTLHDRRPLDEQSLACGRHAEIASALPSLVADSRSTGENVPSDTQRDSVLAAFAGISDPVDLVEAIVHRHESVQAAKGREGKHAWLERSGGGLVVRGPYVRTHAPEPATVMHPTRLDNAASFLSELA